MKLYVLHFTSRHHNEIFTTYFFVKEDRNITCAQDLMSGFDMGDGDPETASHPIEIVNWKDVDPSCYDCLYFSDEDSCEDITLIGFMYNHWKYKYTNPEDENL